MISAEAGVIDQVGAEVIAEALGQRGDDQRKGHDNPGIVHVQEMGNEIPQVEMPLAVGEAEKDGAFGRVGPENLVEDGLEEQDAEGVKHTNRSQQQHAGQPLHRVGQPVAQEPEKTLHAGPPACGVFSRCRCPG